MQDKDREQIVGLPEMVCARLATPEREAVLRRLELLGEDGDAELDRLAAMTARLFEAPAAAVALVDPERLLLRGKSGAVSAAPLSCALLAHAAAVDGREPMVVEDVARDMRFAGIAGEDASSSLRFFAGAPVIVFGEAVGAVAAFDGKARAAPSRSQLDALADLAETAASLLALKDGNRRGEIFREALIREEKRHALALEAASIASWVWDVRTGMLECDPLLPKLFNLPETTRFPAAHIYQAIDPRDLRQTRTRLREAMESGDDYADEYRIRDVSPPRWLAGRGRVVERDHDGKPLLVFGVNFDITRQKIAEEQQRLLLRELNHRVKNTLATVQALANQTVRHSREPAEFLKAFGGRLHALGMAHGLLSDYEWRGIGLDELIRLQVLPYVEDERQRVLVSGDDVFLSPDQALALGLVLHELASNAVRYGALSVAQGRAELSWRVDAEKAGRRLTLSWTERGGPPVAPPEHRGFGSILIQRSLGKLLSSRVSHEFHPEGVAAEISLVLEEPDEAEKP